MTLPADGQPDPRIVRLAAAQGDIATLRSVRHIPRVFEATDTTMWNSLHCACKNLYTVCMTVILASAATLVNTRTLSGYTPLILAVKNRDVEEQIDVDTAGAICLLLAAGADPNIGDEHGTTALWHLLTHEATHLCESGPLLPAYAENCAGILYAGGASIDVSDTNGASLLSHCVHFGHNASALWLVQHGADPHTPDGVMNKSFSSCMKQAEAYDGVLAARMHCAYVKLHECRRLAEQTLLAWSREMPDVIADLCGSYVCDGPPVAAHEAPPAEPPKSKRARRSE